MNNCQSALVKLVSKRLRPVNKAIIKVTFLGPYLSRAQPPIRVNIPANNIKSEKMAEVVVRVRANSLSIDLKNTPKEKRMPTKVELTINRAATTTHP